MSKLETVVFMGSARNEAPRWGGPARLGTRVLKYVVKSLAEREIGHNVHVVDPLEVRLPVLEKPHFYYAAGEAPAELDAIAEKLSAADCFVLVSAEYNHSIPGPLKNALDWASRGDRVYEGKSVALIGAAPGALGAVRALLHLRQVLAAVGAWVVPGMVAVPRAGEAFDEQGNLQDEALRTQMEGLLEKLVEHAGRNTNG